MQYPASFLMLTVGHFIGTAINDVFAMWILFDRFRLIKGWTFFEVALIYGIVHMGFALAESLARGFDSFSQMLKQGDFDRLLLRPISPLLQMAAREVQLMRAGRFLQGFFVLLWSGSNLSMTPFSLHAFVIFLSIVGTAALFYGLFVGQAAISFWTLESLEIMNITTYGGVQTGQYPMSIYTKPFRLIFTFLIPLSCVGYYPIATLLRRETFPLWLGTIAPLSGFLFLYGACILWRIGVRRYHSTGN